MSLKYYISFIFFIWIYVYYDNCVDLIRQCTYHGLGFGDDNENQTQRMGLLWPAVSKVQGRVVSETGVMAMGDLL
jgi:hypothetical protein